MVFKKLIKDHLEGERSISPLPVCFPAPVTSPMTKINMEREELIWCIHPEDCPSSRVVKAETQTWKGRGGRDRSRRHGGILLADLLPWAHSVFSFLPTPGPHLPRGGAAHSELGPPACHSLRKCPTDFTTVQSCSQLKFFLSGDSNLTKTN